VRSPPKLTKGVARSEGRVKTALLSRPSPLSPFLDTDGRIETLYLAALSRKPRPDELEKCRRYVEKGGAAKD
jgi:hypothetical protein